MNYAVNCLRTILIIAVLLPLGCKPSIEETASFKTIFDHYRDRENIMAISFPPGLVGLFLNESDSGQAVLKELMQELSSFRMLSIEEVSGDTELAQELKTQVSMFTSRNEFQELFQMQTAGENIIIKIQENEGLVKEAILMLGTDDSFFVIDIKGNISMDYFYRLAEGGYLNELTSLINIDF